MKQETKLTEPIQPINVDGWMMNDECIIVKIDQYLVTPNGDLHIHVIDVEEDGGECYLGWYNCFESMQIPPRLYSTQEQCKKDEESIRNFEDARKKVEEKENKAKLYAELDNYDKYKLIEYLEDNHNYKVLSKGEYDGRVYGKAIFTFRCGYITISLTSGKTNVRLDSIDYVAEKDGELCVNTKSGFKFRVQRKDPEYGILYLMYIKDIYPY